MALIQSIKVLIRTGDKSGAGTDGDVYVGCFGREFYLDTSADDFERSSQRIYTLGEGGNTLHKELNDPRHPPLDDLRRPIAAYIRFVPRNRGDRWQLLDVSITVNGSPTASYSMQPTTDDGFWMGTHASSIVFIPVRPVPLGGENVWAATGPKGS
jgi:hypothetical protein